MIRTTRVPIGLVIPGWSEGPDPESRDSGFVLRAPRNDYIQSHSGWSERISMAYYVYLLASRKDIHSKPSIFSQTIRNEIGYSHSEAREARTRNLEIPGLVLRTIPE